jgi:hypothetical protein
MVIRTPACNLEDHSPGYLGTPSAVNIFVLEYMCAKLNESTHFVSFFFSLGATRSA